MSILWKRNYTENLSLTFIVEPVSHLLMMSFNMILNKLSNTLKTMINFSEIILEWRNLFNFNTFKYPMLYFAIYIVVGREY